MPISSTAPRARFVETQLCETSGPMVSLDSLSSFLSQVPPYIDFREALLEAGADADFVIRSANSAVRRASNNGTLARLGLSEEEALVIAGYTVEERPGEISMYDALNRTLRGPHDRVNLIQIRSLLALFIRAIRKLPIVEKSEVYRGIDKNLGSSVRNNTTVTWWAFTSATWDLNKTNTFIGDSGGCLFTIKGPCRGYDLSMLSVFPDESELLLEPETQILTTGIVKLGTNSTLVQCNIVPTKPILLGLAPFRHKERRADHPIDQRERSQRKL